MTYATQVINAIKIYEQGLQEEKISALQGCELEVKIGELVSIIGPSGAGKTTLLKVIAGIEGLSSGEVIVGGYPIHKLNETRRREFRRKYIGIFSQHARDNFDPKMKAKDAITWEAINAGWEVKKAKNKAQELLKNLNMLKLANIECGKLSAGESMRISLVKSVAKNPFIILADEPSGQLDTTNMQILYDLMRKICDSGTSILVATHDVRFQSLSDRGLIILDGKLASEDIGINLLQEHEKIGSSAFTEFEELNRRLVIDSNYNIKLPNEIINRLSLGKHIMISHKKSEDFAIIKGIDSINKKRDNERTEILDFSRKHIGSDKIIEFENITKIYRSLSRDTKVLENINFSVNRGDFIVLLGPSGVGKTTLLNLIAGLEPPSTGNINFKVRNNNGLSIGEYSSNRFKHLSYQTQNYTIHQSLSVEENVYLPILLRGKRKNEVTKNVDELLKSMNIEKFHNAYPSQLSGGQRQRVSLAATILSESELILLDEPTANLDRKLGISVMNQLTELAEKGKTVIVATHDFMLVRPGYRVLRMRDRKIFDDKLADDKYCNKLKDEFLQRS
jgi:putative ABC transport system ATP-binding protein